MSMSQREDKQGLDTQLITQIAFTVAPNFKYRFNTIDPLIFSGMTEPLKVMIKEYQSLPEVKLINQIHKALQEATGTNRYIDYTSNTLVEFKSPEKKEAFTETLLTLIKNYEEEVKKKPEQKTEQKNSFLAPQKEVKLSSFLSIPGTLTPQSLGIELKKQKETLDLSVQSVINTIQSPTIKFEKK